MYSNYNEWSYELTNIMPEESAFTKTAFLLTASFFQLIKQTFSTCAYFMTIFILKHHLFWLETIALLTCSLAQIWKLSSMSVSKMITLHKPFYKLTIKLSPVVYSANVFLLGPGIKPQMTFLYRDFPDVVGVICQQFKPRSLLFGLLW